MTNNAKEPLGEYPQKAEGTAAYEVARTTLDAAASLVPGGSYAIGALVQRYVAAPLEKRREEWFQRVGEGLRDLEERFADFDPESLDHNEDFVSAVYTATQAAMRTAHIEKREALRNAILNQALTQSLDETVFGRFVSYVNDFSPAHLRVLHLLAAPDQNPKMVDNAKGVWSGSQISVLVAAVPDLHRDVLNRILSDLERESLAQTSGMNAMGTASSLLAKRTTEYGDMFLAFISSPVH